MTSSALTARWSFLVTAQSLSRQAEWDDQSPSASEVFSHINSLHFQKYALVTSLEGSTREDKVELLFRNRTFMDPE